MKITETVRQFAEPVVQAHGCSLWDVEYVREGADWFLRLYIDKPGGVDINDCEAISRAVDPILDEKDPIPDSYSFEVCSAGLERVLKRPGDFELTLLTIWKVRCQHICFTVKIKNLQDFHSLLVHGFLYFFVFWKP